ncbi:Cupin domain-containing protein [Butyrivibrio sp. ob235]|uniref:N-acetylneuraminate synthase family protein n=1 Tax=Butyrivibrio sp. ob235 TaxID=1761780 RepID=UPI0008C82A28|nr:N-acetylneuraminate synthase family protein [Butyrivibrio sp. ob235]SEM24601.1 Cupin domain-containing protein [Butyrivibrio sp. ob235]
MSIRPLFVFEMANNHQGSVEHGKRIIREIKEVCTDFPEFDYGFKFQYRDLDTFIHPDFKDRFDIKNIKRFQETKLSQEQFAELLKELRDCGFKAICTPFDEVSVDRVDDQGYDYIKIASCSFTDWPLLEKIASKNKPVIASGAGSTMDEVCRVVSFFTNRNIDFSLMHCVAEYPTTNAHLQLNQIDFYKKSFPNIRIGFSTHEAPDNTMPIRLAIAKGARIFEKHVGVPTDTITLNGYSANPQQIRAWLEAAREAYEICGIEGERYPSTEKEQADLAALRRGVFAKNQLESGNPLEPKDYFLAFPCCEGQLVASDLSKYNSISLKNDVNEKAPVMKTDIVEKNTTEELYGILKELTQLLADSNVVVPVGSECEVSHHYGIEKFHETGVAMIDCVNREYCKKILAVLPGQSHPTHYHVQKEETFVVLHGDLEIVLNGEKKVLHKGDLMTVERRVKHSFASENGCVFEEISSTHYANDSFYDERDSFVRPRKTKVHFTKDMVNLINKSE